MARTAYINMATTSRPRQGTAAITLWMWSSIPSCRTTQPPPVISALNAAPAPARTSAIVTWTTDEPGRLRRRGLRHSSRCAELECFGQRPNHLHNLGLTGLTAGANLFYRVTSADGVPNSAASPVTGSPPASFTTPIPDTTPPVISNVSAAVNPDGTVTITWTTNEVATSTSITGSLPAHWI